MKVLRGNGTKVDKARVGETLTLVLTVKNVSDSTWSHTFRSSQQHDFQVRARESEEPVWKWSEGMAFMMAITERQLAPGEEVEFRAEWTPRSPGEFVIRACFPPDTMAAAAPVMVEE